MAQQKAFDRAYAGASEALVEKLRAFREMHTFKQVTVEDEQAGEIVWEYVTEGDGEPLLFIPGINETAESNFLQITELEKHFHVIVVTVPAVPSMAMLTAGLLAVLDAEGLDRVNVYGVAFGGMAAQALLICCPERVEDVILSHTLPPNDDSAVDFHNQRSSMREKPQFLFRNMSVMSAMQAFSKDVPAFRPAEQQFWQAYLEQTYTDFINKEMLLARLDAATDFHANYEMPKDGPEGWGGRVLILESDRDEVVGRTGRAALIDQYPDAEVSTISEYGHMGTLARVAEYVEPVVDFLGG